MVRAAASFDAWSMKIALFGGTGNVGRVLLRMTLDAGHEVTLLVRDLGTVGRQHPLLTVVKGNALDPDAVDKTLVGAEAVLSTLGGRYAPQSGRRGRRSPASPTRGAQSDGC